MEVTAAVVGVSDVVVELSVAAVEAVVVEPLLLSDTDEVVVAELVLVEPVPPWSEQPPAESAMARAMARTMATSGLFFTRDTS